MKAEIRQMRAPIIDMERSAKVKYQSGSVVRLPDCRNQYRMASGACKKEKELDLSLTLLCGTASGNHPPAVKAARREPKKTRKKARFVRAAVGLCMTALALLLGIGAYRLAGALGDMVAQSAQSWTVELDGN